MNDVERPDDSGQYDDDTLLQIIVERIERLDDPVTRRDMRWVLAKLDEATRKA